MTILFLDVYVGEGYKRHYDGDRNGDWKMTNDFKGKDNNTQERWISRKQNQRESD